jgi:hypothetical protein
LVPALIIFVLIEEPEPEVPPDTPVCVGLAQVHALVPPLVLFDKVILAPVLLQIVGFEGLADAVGTGVTVTVTGVRAGDGQLVNTFEITTCPLP